MSWTADDLAFQAAVAKGALNNLTANVRDVDVRDLYNVLEAFDKLNQALKRVSDRSS